MKPLPNLLIVDDTEENLFLLASLTKHIKVNLIQALSGLEALKKTSGLEIALAIIDVKMPGMNGYELANKIMEERPLDKVPIIFVTASQVNDHDIFKGYDFGAVDYFFKPMDNKILLSKINFFLDLSTQKQTIIGYAALLEKKNKELTKITRALNESSKKYLSYFKYAPDGVFIADQNGLNVEVNEAACRMTGYSKDELLALSIMDLIPPASCESAITSFKDLVHKLSSKSYFQYKHKNGTIRWWAINAVKLSENRFLGFAKDITLRLETEESLRLHHFELEMQNDELIKANKEAMDLSEKYSELYEFAPSGYFTLSTENKIQELNHCGAIILGKEKSNLIGSPFDFFVSIDTKPAFNAFLRDVFARVGNKGCEVKLIEKKGKTKYVHLAGSFDMNGKLFNLNAIDITERKLVETALKESQEKYKTMLNASPDGILITNLHGIITDVSDIGVELFGADNRDELIGDHIIRFIPSDEKKTVREVIEKTMNEGIVQSFEIKVRKKNQSLLSCEISSTLIQDQDGTPYSFMIILRDVSRRKELESKQIHADRMASLGEMASGMAHEINQPLNTMSFVMDNILNEADHEENIDKTYLKRKSEKIFENITRIRNIIDHMRVFSRSYDDYILTGFDINKGITQAISMISEQFKHLAIHVNLHLADDLPIMIGNTFKFEQVILNLLLNAMDALMEKKNKSAEPFDMFLDIKSFQENQHLIVSITDNGSGISDTDIGHIMLPFYTTKDSGKGTGLGLSISYQIIKEMNGTIDIASRLMKGTTIKIVLKIPNN